MEYKKRFDFLFTEINKNLKFNEIEDYLETLQNIIDKLDYTFNQIVSHSNLTAEDKMKIIEEILKESKIKLKNYLK